MKQWWGVLLAAAFCSTVLAFCGCTVEEYDTATLVIHWPERTGHAAQPAPVTTADTRALQPTDVATAQSIRIPAYPAPGTPADTSTPQPTDISTAQSITISAYPVPSSKPLLTVNRPPDGNITRMKIDRIPVGSHPFMAIAHEQPNGKGSIVGQALGFVTIRHGRETTVTLTTVQQPGAMLSIWPQKPTTLINQDLQFEAGLTNPDGSVVLYPIYQMLWRVDQPRIAELITYSGKVRGRLIGEVKVTVTDPRIDKSATTTLCVSEQPPTVCLTADRDSVKLGQSVKLQWSTSNATRVMGSGFYASPTALQGAVMVTPRSTTTYSITADGPGGSASSSVTIEVTEK